MSVIGWLAAIAAGAVPVGALARYLNRPALMVGAAAVLPLYIAITEIRSGMSSDAVPEGFSYWPMIAALFGGVFFAFACLGWGVVDAVQRGRRPK